LVKRRLMAQFISANMCCSETALPAFGAEVRTDTRCADWCTRLRKTRTFGFHLIVLIFGRKSRKCGVVKGIKWTPWKDNGINKGNNTFLLIVDVFEPRAWELMVHRIYWSGVIVSCSWENQRPDRLPGSYADLTHLRLYGQQSSLNAKHLIQMRYC